MYADRLRFLFTEDCLKIKKGVEIVSRQHCSNNEKRDSGTDVFL